MKYLYLVKGNHPIFRYINRRCLSLEEAQRIKKALEEIGYEVTIEPIQ